MINAGFRPGSRATLVSVKVAKPMLAILWPFGFPVRFADTGVAQTRGAWPESSRRAQAMRAFPPVSAARLGQATVQTGVKGNKRAGHIGDTLVSEVYVYQFS
jgi:hypothetical protein